MTITMTYPEARKAFLTTQPRPLNLALINLKTKVVGSAPTKVSAIVQHVSYSEVFPDHTGDPRRISLEVVI